MSKEAPKIFTINFDLPFYEEIEAEAKKDGRPTGQLIKLVMRRYLDKVKNKDAQNTQQ